MGEPSKSNTTTGLVSSGSGQSVNAKAVAGGDFAYGSLGSGTAGGMGNAALYDTRTILPNTRKANVSKTVMEAADKEYTKQMNLLSQHWSVGDTSSASYQAQKQAAMTSQYQWELARNKLEEVTDNERGNLAESYADPFADAELPITPIALDPDDFATPDLSDDIVVNGKRTDERIRIRPKDANAEYLNAGVLSVLKETNGVFFPFTPTISMAHKATYNAMAPTHANTDYYIYQNTPAVQIQIQGQFSSQNLDEARYTLAAMHFFRTVVKMHFGKDDNAGLPPPVLILSGYGEFMFPDLNVVVQDFNMELPNNVDYIEVDIGGFQAWVPSLTTFNVTCVVQQTPRQQRDEFNIDQFASGDLINNKGFI